MTLGARAEQSLYSEELVAIAYALDMPPGLKQYQIILLISNKAAALTLWNPH
jgi:hypothetical protein